jgi:LysM repeat protein
MVHNFSMSPNFPQASCRPSEYVCVDICIIRPGDTLYSISQKYDVSVEMLMEANKILNPYQLRAGQKICIPGKPEAPCKTPAPKTNTRAKTNA